MNLLRCRWMSCSYKLEFNSKSLKEWNKLDKNTQTQFKKKLEKCLQNPIRPSAKLRGTCEEIYKIKLRNAGYRLVYQVLETRIVVLVLAIGKRDKLEAYKKALGRV